MQIYKHTIKGLGKVKIYCLIINKIYFKNKYKDYNYKTIQNNNKNLQINKQKKDNSQKV